MLEVFGVIGLWAVPLSLVDTFFKDVSLHHALAQAYLIVSLVILTFAVIVILHLKARKEKYANITEYIWKINTSIKDIDSFIEINKTISSNPEHFNETAKSKIGDILNNLQLVFVSLTGTRCRASLKLTYNKNGRMYYYTFSRDQASFKSCGVLDDHRVACDHDPMDKNPQFLKLFSDDNSTFHYFSNDLMSDEKFEATSFSAYDESWGRTGLLNGRRLAWARERWPLPYRSTITCVVRHGPASFIPERKSIVLGFLTVDSESRGVFSERWDVPIVFAVADALFHPVRELLQIQNRLAALDVNPASQSPDDGSNGAGAGQETRKLS